MRKKLKNISILSIIALVILTLALPVKAEEKICKQHKDYYLFSYILQDIGTIKNNAETTPTLEKVFITDYPKYVISNVPTTLEYGRVAITKGSIANDEDEESIATMNLKTYYDIYSKIKEDGKKTEFTNHKGEEDAYYKLTETNDNETITYYYHGKWFEESDSSSGDPIEFKDMIKNNIAYNGSFLPEVIIAFKELKNTNLIQFTVTRNIDIKNDLANDKFTPFKLKIGNDEKEVGLAPTVYLIKYEDENDCITTYNATINYLDKETKKEVHDPYKDSKLDDGYTKPVDSPEITGCTPDKETVEIKINGKDFEETVYYSCKTETIKDNPKTGSALIFTAWTIGIGALGYSAYYFSKMRKEKETGNDEE